MIYGNYDSAERNFCEGEQTFCKGEQILLWAGPCRKA